MGGYVRTIDGIHVWRFWGSHWEVGDRICCLVVCTLYRASHAVFEEVLVPTDVTSTAAPVSTAFRGPNILLIHESRSETDSPVSPERTSLISKPRHFTTNPTIIIENALSLSLVKSRDSFNSATTNITSLWLYCRYRREDPSGANCAFRQQRPYMASSSEPEKLALPGRCRGHVW